MPAQTFLRWKFVDPYDPTLANTYEFALNPNQMSSPFARRNITAKGTTAINGRTLLIEGQRQPAEWTFSGDFLEPNHYEALRAWVMDRQGRRVLLYDHFGRELTVVPVNFNPTPKRVIARYWRHTYEITCLVLDIKGATFRVDPPYAPRQVQGTGKYEKATITFQPPLSARGAAILHYNITGVTQPNLVARVEAGDPLVAYFRDVRAGDHQFQVTAVSTAGESEPGISPTFNVSAITGPTGITIRSLTTRYFDATLSWNPPTDDGGADLVSYVVTANETSSGVTAGEGTWTVPASTRTFNFKNLAHSGNTYEFSVAGINEAGKQGPAATKTGVTLVATGPGAPIITDLRATSASIRMTWEAPVRDGGVPISSDYVVLESFVAGDNGDAYVQNLDPSTRAHTFIRLKPGVLYRASVYAVNQTNVSSPGVANQNIKTITTPKG